MQESFESRVKRLLKEYYGDNVIDIRMGEGVAALFSDYEEMSDPELLHEILKLVDVLYADSKLEENEEDEEEAHFDWFNKYRS